MLFNNKKASAAIVILIIVLIVLVLGWAISRAGRQCQSNEDCTKNHYCGSDFKCHEFPIIVEEVNKNSLLLPSIILSIAILGAAVILRFRRGKEQKVIN